MKRVSVIIPVYNSDKTIESVLDSILQQTAFNEILNIVIVNDGSTDDTAEVVNSYIASHHSVKSIKLVSQLNQGVSAARNRGVKECGDASWIAFCDSDDLWLPTKLETQLEVIDANPSIDCLGGAFSETPLRIGMSKISNLYKGKVQDICITNFPQPSTVVMKKSVFEEVGGFDVKQRYAEDGNFFLRVAAKYNLYYLPEQLIVYGFGKRGFGVKGLSANLKGMYEGNVKNLKEIYGYNYISAFFYYQMRVFFWLKYVRRIVLSKL